MEVSSREVGRSCGIKDPFSTKERWFRPEFGASIYTRNGEGWKEFSDRFARSNLSDRLTKFPRILD